MAIVVKKKAELHHSMLMSLLIQDLVEEIHKWQLEAEKSLDMEWAAGLDWCVEQLRKVIDKYDP